MNSDELKVLDEALEYLNERYFSNEDLKDKEKGGDYKDLDKPDHYNPDNPKDKKDNNKSNHNEDDYIDPEEKRILYT